MKHTGGEYGPVGAANESDVAPARLEAESASVVAASRICRARRETPSGMRRGRTCSGFVGFLDLRARSRPGTSYQTSANGQRPIESRFHYPSLIAQTFPIATIWATRGIHHPRYVFKSRLYHQMDLDNAL